jgi:hypothetical protein
MVHLRGRVDSSEGEGSGDGDVDVDGGQGLGGRLGEGVDDETVGGKRKR